MDLIEIDKKKCNQDGICISVCPSNLLVMDDDSFPTPIESANQMCIRCGHCVAICPTGALKHRNLDHHRFETIEEPFRLSSEECDLFFKTRRSIRAYKDKPVSKDKLARLIDIARYAPTARNSQGVKWLVVRDRDEIKKYAGMVIDFFKAVMNGDIPAIAANPHLSILIDDWKRGDDHILRNTPSLVITHGHGENRLAQNDCIIAMANLELAATGLGLGCCWAGFFMTAAGSFPPLMEALSLPDGHKCFGAIMVGYPKFRYRRIPIKREPKITWR